MTDKEKRVLDFLKTQTLGVISTIDAKKNMPESAVVAFAETENLELIFGTFNDTRKYKNIQTNARVAFVIGWQGITVQYEGEAHEASASLSSRYRDIQLAKNLGSKKYAFHDQQRYFKITPRWIRYSDFSFDPEKIFELTF